MPLVVHHVYLTPIARNFVARRSRPLAPACNVQFIRNDLTLIWCELTSSIRTRPRNDEDEKANITAPTQATSEGSEIEEKELLLCFRPIREGGNVTGDRRFKKRLLSMEESNEVVTFEQILKYRCCTGTFHIQIPRQTGNIHKKELPVEKAQVC